MVDPDWQKNKEICEQVVIPTNRRRRTTSFTTVLETCSLGSGHSYCKEQQDRLCASHEAVHSPP
jgi:hypothetical protein